MPQRTRRKFLIDASAASLGIALATLPARASALNLPLGLQLYSLHVQLAKDFEDTLKQIAALGFREVETAGFYGHSPQQVKAAMSATGLACVSAHFSVDDLNKSLDDVIATGHTLGLRYIICSFPAIRDPSRLKDTSYRTQVESFTLDDLRWNAERFNIWGRKIKAAGMQFGYHNHSMEFIAKDSIVPFDEMLRITDPALVTFEMDCGWVIVGGGDPAAYLERCPQRFSMLHVKDFKRPTGPVNLTDGPPAAEMGQGTVNFQRIFAAARKAPITHCFVEQEAFDIPPLDALKIDADYMRKFRF
jgi:sugar phosphate isomerase/epimerase